MAELGPDSQAYHREIGAHAAELGIDVLVTVGADALPYADGFDGEVHPVATPEEAGALLEELARPGDRVLIKGSRSVGLERVLGVVLGEILIGGMASLLICMFLGPKFIEYLRVREFGQHIREEGPAGHHGKAGTPTMGGLVIFLAVCVPFLILTRLPRGQPRRVRHRAGHGRARLRRRLDQAAQAALARGLGPHQAARAGCSPRSRCGWW